MLRVGIDATPLLGARSGVGRYLEGLLRGLRDIGSPVHPVLTTFSLRGAQPPAADRAGTSPAPRRLPARLLHPAWSRTNLPKVEVLTGRLDVFHATNFVLPPSRAVGIVTIHDMAFEHHADTVSAASLRYRRLVPRSVRRATLVICFTDTIRDEICAAYDLDAGQVRVIPHGVDPAWASAAPPSDQQRHRWALPARYLVAVGTVEPRKNLGMLIGAHAAARRASSDVPQLVVVGGPGWGAPLDGENPDPSHVVMAGYLPDADLRAVVAGADALCMPSRYEGFGLPVLEAMASGRAVLASDIGAHREVGGASITYLPFGQSAWRDAIVALAVHGDTGSPAQRQARAASFTWRRSAEAHVQAYRDAVGRS
jgi:glycosyltransferase involved in cell wall biosynthesis